ncbi:permease [Halobacteroides halobius DSM 5150]|uniref:Permease n=1 Tax=Halobacteroides halobius (strain ATCC 35273 / DSM 5150 / MD-1) TaxID=748449 RepID=L0K8Z1_HALHC|nr:NCS2 family permease [Halobacteroides halobius]AGB41015.1 permease [Halobacteroides halobius DSM 5150]
MSDPNPKTGGSINNSGILERTFQLSEHNTDIKTEVLAGITTFLTMAYIIFVNPSILSDAGMPFGGVFIATIAGAIVGTLSMALLANYPFALASGMGLNAFFAYTVVGNMGVPWQAALGVVFLEGIIFILLSVTPVRKKIVNCIPMSLKSGISSGIGLFISFIGLQNAGLVVSSSATLVKMSPDPLSGASLVAIIGMIVTGVLYALQVKGALLLGIIISTIIGWFNGVTPPLEGIIAMPKFGEWSSVLFKLDIKAAIDVGIISVLLSFLFVDLFDTAGTLVGVSKQAGYIDEDGNLPKANKALLADAIGTTCGALFGTSTVTTFVESSSGVAEGGRTGLTGVVVSFLFFLALFFKPLISIVPTAATAPALLCIGTMMMANIVDLDWDDFTEVFPAFIAMIAMPLTYSISHGIALGFILYPLVKVFTGRKDEVNWLVYLLGVVFLGYFIWM